MRSCRVAHKVLRPCIIVVIERAFRHWAKWLAITIYNALAMLCNLIEKVIRWSAYTKSNYNNKYLCAYLPFHRLHAPFGVDTPLFVSRRLPLPLPWYWALQPSQLLLYLLHWANNGTAQSVREACQPINQRKWAVTTWYSLSVYKSLALAVVWKLALFHNIYYICCCLLTISYTCVWWCNKRQQFHCRVLYLCSYQVKKQEKLIRADSKIMTRPPNLCGLCRLGLQKGNVWVLWDGNNDSWS